MNMTPDASGAEPPDPPPAARTGWRRTLVRWAGVLCVWLVILEGTAWVALRCRPAWLQPDVAWAAAECFDGAGWVDAYFREWWQITPRWEPYVYWRSRPFNGDFIQIGADGRRRTWRPALVEPDAFRILFFGGSTLWGLGARDDATIPSLVSRGLTEAAGRAVDVVNLGELGYVSTQSLVLLMRELQAGRIPDLVVFYDGVNDVFSAYQSGRAGIPQNEYRREKEFNLLRVDGGRTGYLVAVAAYRVVQQSAFIRLAGRWVGLRQARAPSAPPDTDGTGRLAAQVHAVYLRNLEMVQALAVQMGFEVLFYWQPSVFSKPLRSPHEERQWQAFKALEALTVAVDRALASCEHLRAQPAFHYTADLFETTASGVFFDYCHMGEAGNAAMAARMTQDIRDVMRKGRGK